MKPVDGLASGEWPSSNSMIRVSLWKEVELHRPRPLPVATNKAVKPTVAASCPMIFWAHQADDSSLLRPIGQPQGDPMTEKGLSCPDKVGSQEALYIDIYSTHQKIYPISGVLITSSNNKTNNVSTAHSKWYHDYLSYIMSQKQ